MIDLDRIVPLHPEGSATPLFCVHAVSGSAYSYIPLADLLGEDQPVYGIEAPGFDSDREPVRSLTQLSAEYAETLRAFRPESDFLLLGWSIGGAIAFDMARRLTATGGAVRQVVLIDVSRPQPTELPPEKEIVGRFLQEMLATVNAPTAPVTAMLDGQPEAAGSREIFQATEHAGVLPPELDADLLTGRYSIFRAHIEALYRYGTDQAYHGPVTHLIATESPMPTMRWGGLATHLTEHTVPGSHYSIWTGSSLQTLAKRVRAAIAEASGPKPG
jgi:thioesterase domain-containing protein